MIRKQLAFATRWPWALGAAGLKGGWSKMALDKRKRHIER
jgi:hypothetical protein